MHSSSSLIEDPIYILLQITRENVQELLAEHHAQTVHAIMYSVREELVFFLCKLWNQTISPIVDCLQMIHPSQSHILWCPTAELSMLPLHTTGLFKKGQQNLSDIYVSSYTQILNALIHARQCDSLDSATKQKCFLAMGQANAAGQRTLPCIGVELDTICQWVESFAIITHIKEEEACIFRVAEELGKNKWAHFAYHSILDQKHPFKSAFALHDRHFMIQYIIR